MVRWFRRAEGFEWREHVRTTVLVRRADRDRKLERAQGAAVARIKGVAQRSRQAGESSAGAFASLASATFRQALAGLVTGALRIGGLIASGSRWFWGKARVWLAWMIENATALWHRRPVLPKYSAMRPSLRFSALQLPDFGMRLAGVRWPAAPQFTQAVKPVGIALAAIGMALSFAYFIGGPRFEAAPKTRKSIAARAQPNTITTGSIGTPDVTGRADVIAGDTLRIGERTLRLAGIEAPDTSQTCERDTGSAWPCGENALQALRRLVRGRTVSCRQTGTSDGVTLAICAAGSKDLAAELVAKGHAFATEGFFSQYATLQSEARSAKFGLWRGIAERPGAWRAARWETAKQEAPGGCPIKGLVRASGLVYALPWSKDYEKSPVRTAIGERWFCSEAEALDAGWKAPSKS